MEYNKEPIRSTVQKEGEELVVRISLKKGAPEGGESTSGKSQFLERFSFMEVEGLKLSVTLMKPLEKKKK